MVKITGLRNRDIKKNHRPADLAELESLTNATAEKLVSQPGYQKKTAQGILNGLNVFFNK